MIGFSFFPSLFFFLFCVPTGLTVILPGKKSVRKAEMLGLQNEQACF